jgi:hypothetical protein
MWEGLVNTTRDLQCVGKVVHLFTNPMACCSFLVWDGKEAGAGAICRGGVWASRVHLP